MKEEYERLCSIGGELYRSWRANRPPADDLVRLASSAVYDLARIELEKTEPPPSYEDHEDFKRVQWLHNQTRTWGGVALAINGVTVGTGENVRAAIDSAITTTI